MLTIDDRGQATTEYALVLLVAAAIALTAIIWARTTDGFTGLFEHVIDKLTGDI